MEYRILGRAGWRVSEIACGTFRSFDVPGEAGARHVLALMRANLALGVNLFDSAPMYGHSEANIGAAMAVLRGEPPAAAGSPYIATKVLQSGLEGAKRQIAQSFQAIGGTIDLLQIHNMAGWRTVLPHLHALKEQGRIRAAGVTHYDPAAFGEIEQAMKTGLADVIQVPLNLFERRAEQRLLPLARDMNLGVLVMTPIKPQFARGALLDALERVELARFRPYGVSDAGSLCLKWLLSRHPDVVLLPATSRSERVASNAAVSGTPPLPPDLMDEMEAMFR